MKASKSARRQLCQLIKRLTKEEGRFNQLTANSFKGVRFTAADLKQATQAFEQLLDGLNDAWNDSRTPSNLDELEEGEPG